MRSVMARRFAMTKVRKAKIVVAITRELKSRQRAAADYPSQRWHPCVLQWRTKQEGVLAIGDPASAGAPAQRLEITPDRSGVFLVEARAR